MKRISVIKFKLLLILLVGIFFAFQSCSNKPSLQENARISQTKVFVHSRPENRTLKETDEQWPLSISLQETAGLSQRSFILARDFASGQLEAHYLKHKNQFGDISQDEYLQRARLLLNSAPSRDILEKRRSNGDVLHYRISTGEFAVMAKEGRIRTYFKADYKYWLKQ